jgi:hypothetical protein
MKDYKDLVAAMCDYCGLDNLYPYEDTNEILAEFEALVDEESSIKLSMVIREKKLNDRIRELEAEVAKYKTNQGEG